jgi:hypothetical protein
MINAVIMNIIYNICNPPETEIVTCVILVLLKRPVLTELDFNRHNFVYRIQIVFKVNIILLMLFDFFFAYKDF